MLNRKIIISTVLLCVSISHAQLPDEINYGPYYDNYIVIDRQRDMTLSDLNRLESSLRETLEVIRHNQSMVIQLERQIRDDELRMRELEGQRNQEIRILDELNEKRRQIDRELKSLKSKKQALESQIDKKQRSLRPLQTQLRSETQKLRQLQVKLSSIESKIDATQLLIRTLNSETGQLQSQLAKDQQRLQELKTKEGPLKRRLSQLQSEKKQVRKKLDQLNNKMTLQRSQVKKLQTQLNTQQVILKKLQSSNAPAAKIKSQRQKVKQARISLEAAKKVARDTESRLSRINKKFQEIIKLEKKIQLKISEIPRQLNRVRKKISQLLKEIQAKKERIISQRENLKRYENEQSSILNTKREVNRVIVGLQAKVDRLKDQIARLTQRLRGVDQELQRLLQQKRNILQEEQELKRSIADINRELPLLDREITANQNRLVTFQNEIYQLESESENLRREIRRINYELEDLTQQVEVALREYQQRYNFYTYNLQKAEELGRSQTNVASELGADSGRLKAEKLSLEYGSDFANTYGKFQARLIGLVRGEVKGFEIGYDDGINSQTSINNGAKAGDKDGHDKAYFYADSVLKPQFFEDYLKELLALPIPEKNNKELYLNKSIGEELGKELNTFFDDVAPLSEEERKLTLSFKTSLDEKINNLLKDEDPMQKELDRMSTPSFAYSKPISIPFENVNCDGVYKNIDKFIRSCKESYKASFKQKYLRNHKQYFFSSYSNLFLQTFNAKEPSIRSLHFASNFNSAHDTALREGRMLGEQEAYDSAYERSFEQSYNENLIPATQLATNNAEEEAYEWIQKQAVVTVSASSFSSKLLKSGDSGHLNISLKNIGNKDAVAPGSLKVVSSYNLEFVKESYKLVAISKRSIKTMKIPFKVKGDVSSGEKIKLEVLVTFPGDKYRAFRRETIKLQQELVINPKVRLELSYDKTPKVKGFRSFYIHTLSANLTPLYDNIPKGYSVKLSTVLGSESQELITFKTSSDSSGRINQGETKKLNMSYVFKKAARGKEIKLRLEVFYLDNLVDEKVVMLRPR